MSGLWRAVRLYPALLRVGFAEAVAYRAEFLIWMLTTTMPLVMLALWSAVAREGPVGRYDQPEFIAYFLSALLVRMLTGTWVVWLLVDEIRRGTLSQRLVRPVHPLLAYSADNLAGIPIRVVVALPVVVLLLASSGSERLTSSPLMLGLFVASLAGAWLIAFLSMTAIGCLAFFLESALGIFGLWLTVQSLLSGYLVPLDLLPAAVRDAANVLPFRFMLSYPLELLTGQLDLAAALAGLGLQWLWVGVFAGLVAVAWRLGLRRYAAFGG